ncbi:hypothetical protein FRB94_001651 [Tulasnella sp. JGI-2019a]|nr:hypothetical protein FRB94_001651 [Tulasnella sp. JGI-2019a]KAG9010427.1 hypothetical protein FRB93_004267 [Tulasnella sp. JGI-2019a]KAG9038719.1 hypothetical protein FRB95_000309 [Tulasnella sp. JGI-2019a]
MSTLSLASPMRSACVTLATNGQLLPGAAKYHHSGSACRDEESQHQMPEDEAQLTTRPNDDPHHLEYSIPKVVESLRGGLRDSCNAAATVAALLATIEAAMIVVIKTPVTTTTATLVGSASSTTGSANATTLLLILSYVGLILNASTTFSAHLLVDRLGKFSFMSKGIKPILTNSSVRSARRLLGCYSASGKVWHILEFHYFSTLRAGFLVISAQILTFVWISEGKAVVIISTVTAVFCLIPFITIFF